MFDYSIDVMILTQYHRMTYGAQIFLYNEKIEIL